MKAEISNINFAVFPDNYSKPRTIGHQKLLEYIETCYNTGIAITDEKVTELYWKYVRTSRGYWSDKSWREYKGENTYGIPLKTRDNGSQYYQIRYDLAFAKYHNHICPITGHKLTGTIFINSVPYWYPCQYIEYKPDDWTIQNAAKTWVKGALGALMKGGFLIPIPKGFILKKIDEMTVKID